MVAPVPDSLDGDDMPPEARAAFLVYLATTGERAGQRSYVQTAELTSHPIGTIKSWGSRYRWGPRARDIDRDQSVQVLQAAIACAASQRLHNLHFLIALRDNEQAPWSERRRAAETLLAMGGLANLPAARLPDEDEARAERTVSRERLLALVQAGDTETLLRMTRGERVDVPTDG